MVFAGNFSPKKLKGGVYRILNTATGKCYVGSAVYIKGRWSFNRSCFKNKIQSPKLQNAWNKYGEKNFEFYILELCLPEQQTEREQYWMDFYDSCKNGYNSKPKAENSLGYKHTAEARKKMSELRKGKTASAETRQKMSGRPAWNKGIPHPETIRRKMREAQKTVVEARRGKPGPMTGKRHSEASKKKMSEAQKRRYGTL